MTILARDDFAFLLLSCDKYADMWSPFFLQFRKYIPCEGVRFYVGSNSVACNVPDTISVLSGDDPDWSTSYKRILAQIPERKLFVILEDLLVASPIDEAMFDSIVDFMFEVDAKHIKYWAAPSFDMPSDQPGIGYYHPGAPYRATVCGFWDRKCLMNLLLEGENPWNFEILGSYRTSYSDGFYGVSRSLFEFKNMIEKGLWIPKSVAWAKSHDIALDLDIRPMLKGGSRLVSQLQMLYFRLMVRVPWKHRLALMNKLRKALISY